MKPAEIRIRALAASDLESLGAFRCSTGAPWENAVGEQIRGPLPRRYLASPPSFDGRMLLGTDRGRVYGARHISGAACMNTGPVATGTGGTRPAATGKVSTCLASAKRRPAAHKRERAA